MIKKTIILTVAVGILAFLFHSFFADYWHAHKHELFIGLILALVFCVPAAYFADQYFKISLRLDDRNVLTIIKYLGSKFIKKYSFDRAKPIVKREIERTIKSNISSISKDAVVFSIDKEQVLTNRDRSHYEIGGFHFKRYLAVTPLFTRKEQFFSDACQYIGNQLVDKIDCALVFDRDSDNHFSGEVARLSFPQRIRRYPLGYKEQQSNGDAVIYREDESLAGQNVALFTALVLDDKPLVDFANFAISKGANLVCIAILFNALSSLVDLHENLGVQIISAFDIDLKHFESGKCELCKAETKTRKITFCNY